MTDLDPLLEAIGLKHVRRAGWVRRGVPDPESVAAHSHGVAMLTLLLLPDDLDLHLALQFAVLHDLAEVRVGDLTPHDGVSPEEKAHREDTAIQAMAARWSRGAALTERWRQYERQDTPEAQFVRQLDRLDMALQAVRYAREGHPNMAEFAESALPVLTHPTLRAIGEACLRATHRRP
jgi:putative hydrolase of HD superfamily